MANKIVNTFLAVAALASTSANATCWSDAAAAADQAEYAAEAADARMAAAMDAYQACTATSANCTAEATEYFDAMQADSAAWDTANAALEAQFAC